MPVLRVVNLVMVDLMIFKNCNAMKKIFTRIMLWAVAATALASCANNDINDAINDNNLIEVTLTADKTAVRTELIDGVPYWSKGDAVGAYFADDEGNYKHYKFENKAETASLTASFTGQTEVTNTLYVYYPYTANGATEKGAKVDIPANQEPTATSFDGKADIMLAKPITLDATGKTLENLQFARLGAVVKIVLKDNTSSLAGQHISSLTMTAANNLVGRVYIDVVNQELGELYYGQSKSVNATYAEPLAINGENGVYVIVYPQTLAAGSTLSFEASTEGYAISKSISLPQDIVLESGKLTTLNVSLKAENLVKEEAGLALPFEDDFAWVTGTNENTDISASLKSEHYATGAKTYSANGALKFGSSSAAGVLTTVPLNLSEPFTVIIKAKNYGTDATKVKVTVGETTQTVTLTADYAYYALEFEAASKKEAVTVASNADSKQRFYLDELQVVAGHDVVLPTVPPVLTVSGTELVVSHEASTQTFTYSVANPVEGVNVAISDNANWITTADNDGTVTVTIEANESEEAREGVITVAYTGAESKTVTVSQAAKPTEGGATEVVDVLDRALTGATSTSYIDWSGKTSNSTAVYAGNSAGSNSSIQLRSDSSKPASGVVTTTSGGKVAKIKVTWNSNTTGGRTLDVFGSNTAYTGPADLADANKQGTKLGTIVMGTSTELAIEGDYKYIGFRSNSGAMYLSKVEITWVSGNGGSTPEPEPATPVLTVNPTTLEFDAAAGSKTVTCTIENEVSGVNVTATESVDWLTTSVSGKTVTINATENTATTTRTATVTIAYTGAESKTVAVTQAAAENTGGDEGGSTEKVWTLVKSASEIAVGDQIIIAASGYNYAISTTQSSNNRGQAAITKSGETLATPGNTVQILTVQAGSTSGTFAFYAASPSSTVGYLYCASTSSKNYLRTQASVNAAASWTIAVASNGVATIKSQISGITRNLLSYNQQSSCFACYSSVQKDVVIYKLK